MEINVKEKKQTVSKKKFMKTNVKLYKAKEIKGKK